MTFLERAITDGHAKLTGEGKQQAVPAPNGGQRNFSLSASTGERAGVRCRSLQLDERKKPYAVIECKADGVTDAEFNQAVEQACGNGTWAKFRANYVGVVAGMTRTWVGTVRCAVRCPRFPVPGGQGFSSCRWPKTGEAPAGTSQRNVPTTDGRAQALEREANIIADLPRQYGQRNFSLSASVGERAGVRCRCSHFPKPEEYRFYKGDPNNDISPVSKEALIGAIKKCHQTLWAGDKLPPPAAFGELCKIIFVKISDEQAKRKKGEPYEFQIKTHEPSRRRRDGWGTVFVMGNAVRRRHTCAMKTTGYVRKSAVEQGVSEGKSLKCGAQEKSKVFAERMRNYTQRLEFSKNLL